VLSEFRTCLVAGHAEQRLLDALLEQCRERKLLSARGRQRTDVTHVLGAIRALNSLAVVAPAWMSTHSQPEWIERYGPRVDDYHLPKGDSQCLAHAHTIGADGYTLLEAIDLPRHVNRRASHLWHQLHRLAELASSIIFGDSGRSLLPAAMGICSRLADWRILMRLRLLCPATAPARFTRHHH
jgi:hypothetical protein